MNNVSKKSPAPPSPATPQVYILEWADGGRRFGVRNVKVFPWVVDPSAGLPSRTVVVDHSPSFNPFKRFSPSGFSKIGESERAKRVKGEQVFYVRQFKRYSKHFELYPGGAGEDIKEKGPVQDGRKLLDIKLPSCFGITARFTDPKSGRFVELGKKKGKGGEPCWCHNRSIDDWGGIHYKFKTSVWHNFKIVRTSDNVEVARFDRDRCDRKNVGRFTVFAPLPPELLQLLLCAAYMKNLQDRRRKH